jgi:hypothetical protein
MTLNELRAKRIALEFKLGGLIRQFEDETGLDVDEKLQYDRFYTPEGQETATPYVGTQIDLGYGDAEQNNQTPAE